MPLRAKMAAPASVAAPASARLTIDTSDHHRQHHHDHHHQQQQHHQRAQAQTHGQQTAFAKAVVAVRDWNSPDFLLRVWRRREPQLLRLLTARSLAAVRASFEAELRKVRGSTRRGLTQAVACCVLEGSRPWMSDERCLKQELLCQVCSAPQPSTGVPCAPPQFTIPLRGMPSSSAPTLLPVT